MPAPDWLTVTKAIILADSRLESFMLKPSYDVTTAETDVQRHLDDRWPDVRRRLRLAAMPLSWPFTDEQLETAFPDESDEDRATRDADQKTTANLIIKEMVIADLLKPLGDEQSTKAAQQVTDGRGEAVIGNARTGTVENNLKSLEAEITSIALVISNKAGKRKKRRAIYTGRGDIAGA